MLSVSNVLFREAFLVRHSNHEIESPETAKRNEVPEKASLLGKVRHKLGFRAMQASGGHPRLFFPLLIIQTTIFQALATFVSYRVSGTVTPGLRSH
jgi:hypothetical protein